jgi:hypothetical protein
MNCGTHLKPVVEQRSSCSPVSWIPMELCTLSFRGSGLLLTGQALSEVP